MFRLLESQHIRMLLNILIHQSVVQNSDRWKIVAMYLPIANRIKLKTVCAHLDCMYYHYLHIGKLDLAEVIQPELTNYHMTSGSKRVITYLFCIVCLHHKSNIYIFLVADTNKSLSELPKFTAILATFRREKSFAIISLRNIWVNLLDEARLSEDLIGWEELEGIQELSQRILNNSNSSTISGHFSL